MNTNDFLKKLNELVGDAEKNLDESEMLFFLTQSSYYLSTAAAFKISMERNARKNKGDQ